MAAAGRTRTWQWRRGARAAWPGPMAGGLETAAPASGAPSCHRRERAGARRLEAADDAVEGGPPVAEHVDLDDARPGAKAQAIEQEAGPHADLVQTARIDQVLAHAEPAACQRREPPSGQAEIPGRPRRRPDRPADDAADGEVAGRAELRRQEL